MQKVNWAKSLYRTVLIGNHIRIDFLPFRWDSKADIGLLGIVAYR